ncbi:hypothetical protein MVUOKPPV_CDS0040 [Klebsiella phage phi1_175008]|uniref:Uncharacterized protein n=2 Tax=Klebsiella phage phi1_175008 TaxID=3127744 RepID=A0AC61ZSY1_9CAUD
MTKQYRILERPQFEKESVYIVQRTRKFFWLFPYWSTYQGYTLAGNEDCIFNTIEDAKSFIKDTAKFNRWCAERGDRVIAVYQLNNDGELEEVET